MAPTCPLLVVGQDLPPEEKSWKSSLDGQKPKLQEFARAVCEGKCARVKGHKIVLKW